MSNQSFKVKSGLTLTPVDLTTLLNPQAGDLACDSNDSNKIKRYDANSSAWTEVGSGGVGSVDIMFVQDFESASLATFESPTDVVLSTTDPLHGKVSAILTHQAGVSPTNDQSFKQIIPVDRKFRGQAIVLDLNIKSAASAGNVAIKITDETGSVDLIASEQLQLSSDVSGRRSSVSFTIPSTCSSLSYTITALPEAGSPVTRIDDIVAMLSDVALLETSVEVPVIIDQSSFMDQTANFTLATITGPLTSENGSGVYSYNSSTGIYTVLKSGNFSISVTFTTPSAATTVAAITIDGSIVASSHAVQVSGYTATTSYNGILSVGSTFFIHQPSSGTASRQRISVLATAVETTTKTIPLTQSGVVQEQDSELYAAGNAGQAITANVTNIPFIAQSTVGSAIQWSGSQATVLEDGIYNIFANIKLTAAVGNIVQLYLNGAVVGNIGSSTNSSVHNGSYTGKFQKDDILSIRLGASGTLSNVSTEHFLNISKQGSLKQVTINSNQKITVPTSELRFEGASSRGSTATAIVKFDTMAKLRGDAFTVESDTVLGTRITMKKAGKLDINASCQFTNSGVVITKNQTDLTLSITLPVSEVLSKSSDSTTNGNQSSSYSGFVFTGDIIRIAASTNPTNAIGSNNVLNLSFQEQEIQVSVSNTLPQFSESDSCVRLDTANGYGSTGTKIRRFANERTNIGNDILYTPSAVNGDSFVIQTSGIYNISYSEYLPAVAGTNTFGITKNASSLNTAISSLGVSERLSVNRVASSSIVNGTTSSWSGFLQIGDIIRGQTDGGVSPDNQYVSFTISKVGKPNVTGVDVTPFVNTNLQLASRYILKTITNGTEWYEIYNDGWTRQGGQINVNYNQTTTIVSLPVQMDNSSYSVLLTLGGAVVNDTAQASYQSLTTTQFSIYGDYGASTGTLPTRWIVEGQGSASAIVALGVTLEDSSRYLLTPTHTFSTDTASLSYAGSAAYTLSTLQNAPVGTFITFTYAANTNTRTQTVSTAPSQSVADMNANGIQLFTRAYNDPSTAGSPAAIAIQIGKGLKGKSLDLYKSVGKVISGELDSRQPSPTSRAGVEIKSYNEITGILLVDAGFNDLASTTASTFRFSDTGSQTSGYLVINASKNPALTGIGLNRIAMRATSTAGGAIGTTNTLQSFSEEVFDTNGAWNGNTFTAPETGYYQVSAGLMSAVVTNPNGGGLIIELYKNGASYSACRCVGTGAANAFQALISDVMFLEKNDTISLYCRNSLATTQNTTAGYNFISISKVSV